MMLRGICLRAALACVLTLTSCRGTSKTTIPRSYRGGAASMVECQAVRYLHKETPLLVVVSSLERVKKKLMWPNLLHAVPVLEDTAREALGEHLGAALLDSAWHRDAGIADDQRMGIAMLDAGSTFAMFVTLADAERFKTKVSELARQRGGSIETSTAGDGQILVSNADERRAIVIRGDYAFLIVSEGARSVRDLAAVRIASIARDDSLAEHAPFRDVLASLAFGRDVSAYLSIAAIVAAAEDTAGELRTELGATRTGLAAQIARARITGTDAQVAQLKLQEQWLDEQERQLDQGKASRELAADFGAIGVGVDVKEGLIAAKLVSRPARDGLVSRLLSDGPGRFQLLMSTALDPLLLVSMHTRPQALLELVALRLRMSGIELDNVRGALEDALGVDLERDVLPLLTGEVGLAITALPELRASELSKTVGVNILLGIRDHDAVGALLSRIVENPMFAAWVDDGPTDGDVILRLPSSAPVTASVTKTALVLSTDPSFSGRVREPASARSFVTGLENRALAKQLSGPARGQLLIESRLLWAIFGGVDDAISQVAQPATSAAPSPQQIELEAQVSAIEAKLRAQDATARGAEEQATLDAIRAVGHTAFTVVQGGDHLAAYGGHFFRTESLGALLSQLEAERERRDGRAQRLADQQQPLRETLARLREALTDVRARDADAWEKQHRASP